MRHSLHHARRRSSVRLVPWRRRSVVSRISSLATREALDAIPKRQTVRSARRAAFQSITARYQARRKAARRRRMFRQLAALTSSLELALAHPAHRRHRWPR